MTRWSSTGSIVGLACTLLAGSWAGRATAAWPEDRPIEIIVGFQAGSGPDILARRLAPVLARRLGPKASFVVNNRTGAGGEIALAALARAEPNGYTIGALSTPSFIIIPLVKKPQYDPAAIMPLARVVDDPTLVVAGGASPVRDIADLVARVKASPGTIAMGHNGVGTNGHLAALAVERAAGARLNDIPFKGTSESRTALLGGHVDIVGMSVSEFAMDREAVGLFKGLAQLGPVRFPAAGSPDGARTRVRHRDLVGTRLRRAARLGAADRATVARGDRGGDRRSRFPARHQPRRARARLSLRPRLGEQHGRAPRPLRGDLERRGGKTVTVGAISVAHCAASHQPAG
jgi:tripartite-type tricarboxylate transporter receptor subunit TctC